MYNARMNVCVFCSASDVAEKYTRPAAEFAALLGKGGHTLVWGGNNRGIMNLIAQKAKDAGGKLIGVNVRRFKHWVFDGADEMHFLETLAERKAVLIEKADAVVVLVGGIGTLDEASEVLELKKHGAHIKPLVILNTDNFYDGLKRQLERMESDGFLNSVEHDVHLSELIYFAESPEDAMAYLEKHGN